MFPKWKEADFTLSLIEKGGSGRTFVRINEPLSGESVIAMAWNLDRADNPRFASITDFLNHRGIPAPAIVERREDLNLLWVEDLGHFDIGGLSDADWATTRFPAYQSALRSVFALHEIRESEPPAELPELELPFDEALYRWEQNYFLTQYVERFVSKKVADELRGDPTLQALCEKLSNEPRALVHRDFQSTNVMIRKGRTFLIDYQGLRWGLPEYDLASMIYDPYSEFSESETEELIRFYYSLKKEAGHAASEAEYRRTLNQCAMQRLMQALGAYGFLGEVKGKREFLDYIPVAMARLLQLAQGDGGLPVLVEKLD